MDEERRSSWEQTRSASERAGKFMVDANQATERKFKHVSDKKRHEHGDAYLTESVTELEDSHEKGCLFGTRAVRVHWDNQRKAVLITSLSRETFSSDNVVRSHFDRWPMQELTFRGMKSQVNIHRVVGYGKRSVDNVTVMRKIEQLRSQIRKLEDTLAEPLRQIRELGEALQARVNEGGGMPGEVPSRGWETQSF